MNHLFLAGAESSALAELKMLLVVLLISGMLFSVCDLFDMDCGEFCCFETACDKFCCCFGGSKCRELNCGDISFFSGEGVLSVGDINRSNWPFAEGTPAIDLDLHKQCD